MHWRTEPTSVEKDRDELCLGVKGQSNSEIAGSLLHPAPGANDCVLALVFIVIDERYVEVLLGLAVTYSPTS